MILSVFQALLQLQGNLLTKERVLAQIIEEREQVFTHFVQYFQVCFSVFCTLCTRRSRSSSG